MSMVYAGPMVEGEGNPVLGHPGTVYSAIASVPRIPRQFTIVRGHRIPTYPQPFPMRMWNKKGPPCMAMLQSGKVSGPQF